MDLNKLREQINKVIDRYRTDYPLDDILLFKFNARYNHLLRELEFDLATFGIETLIRYFTSWSNNERFTNLEYYSNLLAMGDDSHKELFVLYATVNINEAFVSFLRDLPKDKLPRKNINKVMFELHRSIESQSRIPDQLEVWKRYFNEEIESKIEVPEMFRETPHGRLGYLHKFEKDVELLCKNVFPESTKFYTSLMIPEKLFKFNFEFVQNDPEYTFWFLKYNAQKYFEINIMSDIHDDLESPLRKEHINGYLEELRNEEQVVKDLVSKHSIHSSRDNPEFVRQTELLRIIENYYELNLLHGIDSQSNVTIELYAKHVYLKDYLNSFPFGPNKSESKDFIKYFADSRNYHGIMKILVKNGKCDPQTHLWIDLGAGYKRHLAELFTVLHTKGYFVNNVRMEATEKQFVALNTFGVEISIDTAKRSSKPSALEFDYIPVPSQLYLSD